jgi:nucleotide-binding universal stress UspA family protein
MYQKILVPLDGSELAECVLPHVEAVGKGCEVRDVILIRVIEHLEILTRGGLAFSKDDLHQMETEHRAEAEKYLKQVAARLKEKGLIVRSEVLEGKPAEAIAEYAKKNEVDLIILATHGRSGLSRWYWGSVADRILRSVCVPILMVRVPGCYPGI